MEFIWRKFLELSPDELYSLLALRSEVFVVEQNCVYQDLDNKDQHAIHLLGINEHQIVAYLRIFPPDQGPLVFGRVVTASQTRGKGYGRGLLKELLNYCEKHYPDVTIHCSAQYYLKEFYESFGFKTTGKIYNEDGIPHIAMDK